MVVMTIRINRMVLLANFGYDAIQWRKGDTMGIIISIEYQNVLRRVE